MAVKPFCASNSWEASEPAWGASRRQIIVIGKMNTEFLLVHECRSLAVDSADVAAAHVSIAAGGQFVQVGHDGQLVDQVNDYVWYHAGSVAGALPRRQRY